MSVNRKRRRVKEKHRRVRRNRRATRAQVQRATARLTGRKDESGQETIYRIVREKMNQAFQSVSAAVAPYTYAPGAKIQYKPKKHHITIAAEIVQLGRGGSGK